MESALTASEQKLINAAILSSPEGFSGMKLDYAVLAEKAGYKSSESARVNFGKARRKLIALANGDPDAANPATPTKASPNKVVKNTKKAAGTPVKGKGAKKGVKKEEDAAAGKKPKKEVDDDAEKAIVKEEVA